MLNNTLSDMGIAAQVIAGMGVKILPFSQQKKPYPGFSNWGSRATTDKEIIRQWWTIWPDACIAAPTGRINGFWVVDLDTGQGKQGLESLAELEKQFGLLPATMIVRTPTGGLHYYFKTPEGIDIPTTASVFAPNLDTRGEGGLIIMPPSVRPDGKYEIISTAENTKCN